jgi:hypothetical protein
MSPDAQKESLYIRSDQDDFRTFAAMLPPETVELHEGKHGGNKANNCATWVWHDIKIVTLARSNP